MEIKLVDIELVKPYHKNPRINEGDAITKVAMSIKEYGWRQPIVVDSDHVVIAGHTRLKAAQFLGLTQVPIHIAKDLTNEKVKAYRLADNRVALESSWDIPLLETEMLELKDLDFDLSLTGFNQDQINNLLKIEEEKDFSINEDKTQFIVLIECLGESDQQKIYEELEQRGFKCKLIM